MRAVAGLICRGPSSPALPSASHVKLLSTFATLSARNIGTPYRSAVVTINLCTKLVAEASDEVTAALKMIAIAKTHFFITAPQTNCERAHKQGKHDENVAVHEAFRRRAGTEMDVPSAAYRPK